MDYLLALPNEIKSMIYENVILLSVKRKEFKEELQTMWFKCRINRLLDETLNISEVNRDAKFENFLCDIDGLDVNTYARSVFHECVQYLYKVLTADSQKTRWLFHILGFDVQVLNHLVNQIRTNYIRAYATHDSEDDPYLLGYILLEKGGQCINNILGEFTYVWLMDSLSTSTIDKHFDQCPTIELGNVALRQTILQKCTNLHHKTVYLLSHFDGGLSMGSAP